MKTIEILVGIPCSGKSTYARKEDLSLLCQCNVVVSRDTIRESNVFKKPYRYSRDNEDKVTELFNHSVTIALKEGNAVCKVILDNTHCKEKYINEIIRRYPQCKIKVKFFDIPLWKAHYRNVRRYLSVGKWIPISVINNMKKSFDRIDRSKYG